MAEMCHFHKEVRVRSLQEPYQSDFVARVVRCWCHRHRRCSHLCGSPEPESIAIFSSPVQSPVYIVSIVYRRFVLSSLSSSSLSGQAILGWKFYIGIADRPRLCRRPAQTCERIESRWWISLLGMARDAVHYRSIVDATLISICRCQSAVVCTRCTCIHWVLLGLEPKYTRFDPPVFAF